MSDALLLVAIVAQCMKQRITNEKNNALKSLKQLQKVVFLRRNWEWPQGCIRLN